MWQEVFEEHGTDTFTVVGLALDAEGISPAKRYYERFGVKFPALVDADYATRFGAVPKTFLVDERGVVVVTKDWRSRLPQLGELAPVTDATKAKWSKPGSRLDSSAILELVSAQSQKPGDLTVATQLGSRYVALGLHEKARVVLRRAAEHYDARVVAKSGGEEARLLGQAYFQLCRSYEGERDRQVHYATLSFFLSPTVGFGKQIARIISPEKFDGRPNGGFDNSFREGTLRRLKREREAWLSD